MGLEDDINDIRRRTRTVLEQAAGDRQQLVPILGAGTSVPLGLPNWQDLMCRVSQTAGIPQPHGQASDVLLELSNRMGGAAFEKSIQHELSLSENATSLTLQALVQASPKLIVTTNLDHAIENAFHLARRPLRPSSVICGTRRELGLVGTHLPEPQLLKLHGSLERPWTWVLTSKEYDEAYTESGAIQELFRHRLGVPFFIGFSLTDEDISGCLRMAKAWRIRSYAALRVADIASRQAEFNRANVIPIPFERFDQIPEIIDEVFSCCPPDVEFTYSELGTKVRLSVGASISDLPTTNGVTGKTNPDIDIWVKIVKNATDVRPMKSIVNGEVRRRSGQKGKYLSDITQLIESDANSPSLLQAALVRGLSTYKDVFFDRLLPHVLQTAKQNCFQFLSTSKNILRDADQMRFRAFLLQQLDNIKFPYKSIRDIAKLLGSLNVHPAMSIPPLTADVERLRSCVYPLTRNQVGQLLGDQTLMCEHPVQPYTIRDWEESESILRRLREATGQMWRLPNKGEWRSIAGIGENEDTWPWGNEPLSYGRHGRLRFKEQEVEKIEERKFEKIVEVGCYPAGASAKSGLLDLIGNVYELLCEGKEIILAGGAWSTDVTAGQPPNSFRFFRGKGKGEQNVGMRPVYDI